MLAGTNKGGAGDAVPAGAFQHGGRRHAQRVGDQTDGMAEGDVHQLLGGLELIGGRPVGILARFAAAGWIDVVAAQQVVHVGAVAVGDFRREAALGGAGLGADRQILRHQQIDTVGMAVGMGVDPGQFDFELLRGGAGRAEHAEPAGAADRGDHVAAMAERHQRKADPQHLTELGLHQADILNGGSTSAGSGQTYGVLPTRA
jgi:hypothetical protein